jgi:hypothetical protein
MNSRNQGIQEVKGFKISRNPGILEIELTQEVKKFRRSSKSIQP